MVSKHLSECHYYRCMEVCLELNLMEGVKFHEKLVNHIVPVETDLASSWISLAVFREKQYQVRLENIPEKSFFDCFSRLISFVC